MHRVQKTEKEDKIINDNKRYSKIITKLHCMTDLTDEEQNKSTNTQICKNCLHKKLNKWKGELN